MPIQIPPPLSSTANSPAAHQVKMLGVSEQRPNIRRASLISEIYSENHTLSYGGKSGGGGGSGAKEGGGGGGGHGGGSGGVKSHLKRMDSRRKRRMGSGIACDFMGMGTVLLTGFYYNKLIKQQQQPLFYD